MLFTLCAVAKKKQSFLFRADPQVLDALRRWADDELRSVNAQLEYIVRRALREAGRLPDALPDGDRRKRSDTRD